MTKKPPMIGVLFATEGKTTGANKKTKIKSVNTPTAPSSSAYPEPYKPLTDRQQIKHEAKYQKKRATEDWIAGRIKTTEHKAVHDRANHVICGKEPHEFKGPSGERKTKYL